MKMPDEEYLGDGLYVAFDGETIRLRAPRENGDHIVYLEPVIFRNLLRFLEEAEKKQRTITAPGCRTETG